MAQNVITVMKIVGMPNILDLLHLILVKRAV